LSPILPFINDTKENIEGILDYCIKAKVYGIINFNMGLTLREGNREYFYHALDQYFPGMKVKYHQKFGYSYEIISDNNRELMNLFNRTCREHGIVSNPTDVFAYLHKFPEYNRYKQISLIENDV
ncbi:MAG: radical SAM protein, partial [Sedimentibacter sp.]